VVKGGGYEPIVSKKTMLDMNLKQLLDSDHLSVVNGFLVSKETVVLRQWRDENKNFVLSNKLMKVELPP